MRRYRRSILLMAIVAALYTACGGSGGTTGPTDGTQATGPSTPAPDAPSDRPDGGGTGGGGASLSTSRFRTVHVAVSPANGGTVSDDRAADGSAVRECTDCRQRYRLGTRVVVTATAAPGFAFERWQGGACDGSRHPTCALTVEAPVELTARFR